jgi:hypothetical protein
VGRGITPDPTASAILSSRPAPEALQAFPVPDSATSRETDDAHLLIFDVDLGLDDAMNWYVQQLQSAGYAVDPGPVPPPIVPTRTLDFTTPANVGAHHGSLAITAVPAQRDESKVLVLIK